MNAKQFTHWLTGFIECINCREDKSPAQCEWNTIKSALTEVICWEIELGESEK